MQTLPNMALLLLKARLPINKTEAGSVWSLISKPCRTESTGGLPLFNSCPTLRKQVPIPPGHGIPTSSVHTSGMYSVEN